MFVGTIYVLEVRGGLGKAAMTKTGPNDEFCVVWAIGKFYFSFFRILYLLTTVQVLYIY